MGGHLTALRRVASGGFSVDDAVSGDTLSQQSWERLIPLSSLLPDLPAVHLTPDGLIAVEHGRAVGRAEVAGAFPKGPRHPRGFG